MANDLFGVEKKYETNPNGARDWYMDHDLTGNKDPRTGEFEGEVSGSGKNTEMIITLDKVRMDVYAESRSSFEKEKGKIEYDQKILSHRKYMLFPKDWKNVEITAYVKVTDTENGKPAHFEWQCRGGRHTDEGPGSNNQNERCGDSNCITCEGTAYHANLYETGDEVPGAVVFEKELEHISGYHQHKPKKKVTGSLMNRWIGYKAVFYSFKKDGKEVVKLEQWLDEGKDNIDQPGNKWGNKPVREDTDDGDWESGDKYGHCGGTSRQEITWGGPIVIFRSDKIKYSFKWASVREIIPPQ